MSKLTGIDEFPAQNIPATTLWSENFAAMFSNPATRVAVFFSIGRWHSDPTLWREVLIVSLPDARTLYHRGYSRGTSRTAVGSSLLQYEIIKPEEAVSLIFDGPMFESNFENLVKYGVRSESAQRCKLELRFDSALPIWNMKGDSAEAAAMAGSMHIDHIGRVNGNINYGAANYPFIDGYVARDHSRGVRDASKYGGHNWLNGTFPGGRSFHVYAMRSSGSAAVGMSNAAVIQDARIYPAALLETTFISSPQEAKQKHTIALTSELGEMKIDIVEVLNSVPNNFVCPFDVSPGMNHHRWAGLCFDESVRMKWADKEGYGWSERGCVVWS